MTVASDSESPPQSVDVAAEREKFLRGEQQDDRLITAALLGWYVVFGLLYAFAWAVQTL